MKLLNCTECHDIVKIPVNGTWRYCWCGKAGARYVNDVMAELTGTSSRCIGIDSRMYERSLTARSLQRENNVLGENVFEWWLIPLNQGTVVKS